MGKGLHGVSVRSLLKILFFLVFLSIVFTSIPAEPALNHDLLRSLVPAPGTLWPGILFLWTADSRVGGHVSYKQFLFLGGRFFLLKYL